MNPHSEADTCRRYVVPRLTGASWKNEPHSIAEQRSFTDGHIIVVGGKAPRGKQKRGKKRVLVTMATDTGKTVVAFQIFWTKEEL